MKKTLSFVLASLVAVSAVAAPVFQATQPADLTAYAKCQLDMPEFDSFDYHVHRDNPKYAACQQLSEKITKEHFTGDFSKFQDFYRDNGLAIVMEVKTDYK